MLRYFLHVGVIIAGISLTAPSHADDYLCQVKVTNNVEGAVVDTLVCQFYFIDGTQYYHEKDVNILHGEAGYNDSNTNTNPTKRVTTVARVIYNGQTVALTHDSGDAGEGQCWILVPLEINPAFVASVEKIKKAKTSAERLGVRFKCGTVDPKTGQKVERDWVVVEDFDKYVKELQAKGK